MVGTNSETRAADFVPALRPDLLRREVDGEWIVWSPLASEPVVLDPVAATMLEVFDGDASVAVIAKEVHEEVGVSLDVAGQQLDRIVRLFDIHGLLTTSVPSSTAPKELFVSPCSSCVRNSVRGMNLLKVEIGGAGVGVATDSSRATKRLRAALDTTVITADEEAPIGFVLTAPTGFTRSHSLHDRSGFVHSQARGLDAGLQALASHLTAFLPLAAGTVRVRARSLVVSGQTVVCLFPHLYDSTMSESEWSAAGVALVDRLALDIDIATGEVSDPAIPWPTLATRQPPPGHLASGSAPRRVAAVVSAVPSGQVPLTRAGVVAALASDALGGSPSEVLEGVGRLVEGARILSAPPERDALHRVLGQLGQ